MATRLLEQYKWTKDGRKWVFYTWETTLSGKKRKKFSFSCVLKIKNHCLRLHLEVQVVG